MVVASKKETYCILNQFSPRKLCRWQSRGLIFSLHIKGAYDDYKQQKPQKSD